MQVRLKKVFQVLVLSTFCAEIVQTIILPSLPAITKDLKTSSMMVQSSFTFFFLAMMIANLLSPIISGLIGAARAYCLGLLIALTGSMMAFILLNIFPSFFLFILCRILEGFGIQLAATFNQVFIGSFFTNTETHSHGLSKTQVFSILFKTLTITGMIAPIIGSFLMHLENWQLNFFASALAITTTLMLFYKNFAIYKKETSLESKTHIHLKDLKEISQNFPFFLFCFLSAISTMVMVFYVVKSPFLFMQIFHMSAKQYAFCNALIILSTVIGASVITFGKKLFPKNKLFTLSLGTFAIITVGSWLLSFIITINLFLCLGLLALILGISAMINPLCSSLALDYKIASLTLKSSFMNITQMLACVMGSFFATYIPDQLSFIFAFLACVGVFVFLGGKLCHKKYT